jgi:hypothetical protein
MKTELQARLAALNQEIRHYPTPIARCDLHLPALIEERAKLQQQLNELEQESDGGVHAA